MARVSVVVLAHNEDRNLPALVAELDLQRRALEHHHSDLLILANGCSDDTASVARKLCEQTFGEPTPQWDWRVEEVLPRIGKAGAWNVSVHRFLRADSEVAAFIDADLTFFTHDEIARCADALLAHPDAWVSAGRARRVRQGRSVLARFAGMVGSIDYDPHAFCGGHFTMRADIARRVMIPLGLIIEDGLIKALLMTDFFRGRRDESLVRVDTFIGFEPETTLRGLFRHELSLTVGQTLNCFLFEDLHRSVGPGTPDAGEILAERHRADPLWFRRMVTAEIERRGRRCVHPSVRHKRLIRLRSQPPLRQALLLVPTLVAWLADGWVAMKAARVLRSGSWFGFWKGEKVPDEVLVALLG
jgi:glycosyltransferase involved in cell wall biosynthesis